MKQYDLSFTALDSFTIKQGTVYSVRLNPALEREEVNKWIGRKVSIWFGDLDKIAYKGSAIGTTGIIRGIEMNAIGDGAMHRNIGLLISDENN